MIRSPDLTILLDRARPVPLPYSILNKPRGKGMFLDIVSKDQARQFIASGRKAWEYKTKDPHVGPIFGPAYDDHVWLNRAKKEDRYAETVEAAQKCAKALGTDIDNVVFLAKD